MEQTVKNLSCLKTTKWLSSDDLKKILIGVNVIGIDAGPIMLMNNKSYAAKTYQFKTLDELISYFSANTQIILVYDFRPISINLLEINKGDKIKITGKNEKHIICDCDAEINFTFTDFNTNNNYTDFMFRIYEEIDINSDNFQKCDSIEECIIPQVETKLNEIIEKEKEV